MAEDRIARSPDEFLVRRIVAIEADVARYRAEAYHRAGIALPAARQRFAQLVELASIAFNMSHREILGRSQRKEIVRARWAVMWVASKGLGLASTEIGRMLSDRDHSTVIHSFGRVEETRAENESYRAITDQLLELIVRSSGPSEEADDAPSSH